MSINRVRERGRKGRNSHGIENNRTVGKPEQEQLCLFQCSCVSVRIEDLSDVAVILVGVDLCVASTLVVIFLLRFGNGWSSDCIDLTRFETHPQAWSLPS